MLRKFTTFFLCCLLLLSIVSFSAFAVENDADAKGSICFQLTVDDKPLETGSLRVIEIAARKENGDYVWTDYFVGCGMDFEDLSDKNSVQKLAEFAEGYSGPYWTVFADGTGSADMLDVELGLYLVLQNERFDECYELIPFVLSVPSWEDNQAIYDVVSIPKISVVPSPPPPPPEIPKTGQLNWPIPVLLIGGCLFVLLGILLWKRKSHEADS